MRRSPSTVPTWNTSPRAASGCSSPSSRTATRGISRNRKRKRSRKRKTSTTARACDWATATNKTGALDFGLHLSTKQSFALFFLLIFDKICFCVGAQSIFCKKMTRNVWLVWKKALPLHSLSWKQSFYLRKLIPIEDMERSLAKVVALFFALFSRIVKLS